MYLDRLGFAGARDGRAASVFRYNAGPLGADVYIGLYLLIAPVVRQPNFFGILFFQT